MSTDQDALTNLVTQLENSWNRYDSRAHAELFAEDAVFIQIYGGQLDGRGAIEASHRSIFDTIYKASHATFAVRGIRLVRPDVAIVFTRAKLTFSDGQEMREMETRPTLIAAKEEGTWRIVAAQNTKVSEMPAAARAARLLAS